MSEEIGEVIEVEHEFSPDETMSYINFLEVLKYTAQGRLGEFDASRPKPKLEDDYVLRFDYRTYEANNSIIEGCDTKIRSLHGQLEEY